MSSVRPCVLTIAGSDSGGGAGVQADARTIHALGGFAAMAITTITAQNTRAVRKWRAEPPALIAAQLEAVLSAGGGLPIRAIKTGLLPGAPAVRAVARTLAPHRQVPLVIDPVIGSTSGAQFLDRAGIRALRTELLPGATVVTPNWPEAEALTGMRLQSFTDAEQAAEVLVGECGCAVLVKGGHGPGSVCRDCLVTRDGQVHWFEAPRVATPNTHGTGCVLASAIATRLAQGAKLESAVKDARAFLLASLKRHRRDKWDGAGPAFPG